LHQLFARAEVRTSEEIERGRKICQVVVDGVGKHPERPQDCHTAALGFATTISIIQ